MKRIVFNVQIITSIVSKETYLFEKQNGDEVRKKKSSTATVTNYFTTFLQNVDVTNLLLVFI